jgi:hypothetical protein
VTGQLWVGVLKGGNAPPAPAGDECQVAAVSDLFQVGGDSGNRAEAGRMLEAAPGTQFVAPVKTQGIDQG